MFEEIEDEMILHEESGGVQRPLGESRTRTSFEAERNQRKSSLIEELIKEAPDEYLDKWDLQSRQLQNESDTATGSSGFLVGGTGRGAASWVTGGRSVDRSSASRARLTLVLETRVPSCYPLSLV